MHIELALAAHFGYGKSEEDCYLGLQVCMCGGSALPVWDAGMAPGSRRMHPRSLRRPVAAARMLGHSAGSGCIPTTMQQKARGSEASSASGAHAGFTACVWGGKILGTCAQAHGVLWAAAPADTPANWPIAPPIVSGKVGGQPWCMLPGCLV